MADGDDAAEGGEGRDAAARQARALDPAERRRVVDTAVELLGSPRRAELVRILEDRLAAGDHEDARDRGLDEIALALVRTIAPELEEPAP